MRRTLLKSIAALALALGSPVWLWADNVVYGLLSSYEGAYTTSFDLDAVNTSSAAAVAAGYSLSDISGVKCGVCAGNKYYAFVDSENPTTYEQTTALVTVNFTTGEKVVVNDFSYDYGKLGYNICGLAYNPLDEQLYGIENEYDESEGYITKLFTVNPENGTTTEVTSWAGQYQSIVSNGKGGFYLLKNEQSGYSDIYPNLYKVSGTFAVGSTPLVANTTLNTGWNANYSMVVSEDGKKVYAIIGKKVVTFDLDAKTTELKGETADIVAGATFGKSSENGVHNEKPASTASSRFLIEQRFLGNSMGDIPTDMVSNYKRFYYNTDGKKVGEANFGRNYDETTGAPNDIFTATDITKPTFDENGNITRKDTYQWKQGDFEDYEWKMTKNSEKYKYDENGRLEADTISNLIHVYTYTDEGYLETVSTYRNSATPTLEQKVTYSQFDDKGNPYHYSSEGKYDSYNYEGECYYDANGNKIEEGRYKFVPDPDYPTDVITEYISHEIWTYDDNGILVRYEKNDVDAEGKETPNRLTEYTPVDGNNNLVNVTDKRYFDGQWYQGDQPQQLVYGDFSDMKEMTYMEMNATPDAEEVNTVDLNFTVPNLSMTQPSSFVIYRDCMPIDTLSINDVEVNDMTGMCIYKDKRVKNGNYSYFIQPIFSAYNEGGDLLDLDGSDDATGEDQTEWTGYYSTLPANIDVYTELPAVADLKFAGGEKKTEGSSLADMRTNYYADLSWANPENAADYGFKKNSVWFVGSGVSETSVDDAAATTARVMLYDEDANVYVVTSYDLGYAVSDTITVKLKDIDDLSAIDNATANGTSIAFSNNTITLGNNANVAVFSVGGQKVSDLNDVNTVSLDNLPKGTYVITVEKNGKVSAYKYNVK